MTPNGKSADGWTLGLSRGWTWHMRLTGAGHAVARIEQTSPDGHLAGNAIEVRTTDLHWVAHWLRGSYMADEWPPMRQFGGGAVLFMEPVPKPELWIEQQNPHEHGSEVLSSTDAPKGRLMLFEEDLRPIVEWLLERSSVLGVDFVSMRGRPAGATPAGPALENQSARGSSAPVDKTGEESTDPRTIAAPTIDGLDPKHASKLVVSSKQKLRRQRNSVLLLSAPPSS